jgi:hypothetical protein
MAQVFEREEEIIPNHLGEELARWKDCDSIEFGTQVLLNMFMNEPVAGCRCQRLGEMRLVADEFLPQVPRVDVCLDPVIVERLRRSSRSTPAAPLRISGATPRRRAR